MEPRALQFKDEGNKKFKEGKYQDAIKDYTTAIGYAPKDATLYGNRSAAWFMVKAYKQAVDDCITALRNDPSFSKARQRLVKAYIQLGEFSKAKENINYLLDNAKQGDDVEALKKDKTLIEALEKKLAEAEAAFASNKYAAALGLYRELESEASAADKFTLKQIEANLLLENYTQVIRDSLQVIRADSSNSDAYYLRAKGLYYMENYDQAVSHFQECLRLNPDHSGAARDIKRVRQIVRLTKAATDAVFVRNFEDAVNNYTEALELDKENKRLNAKLLASRAEARYRLNDFDKALEDIKVSVKLVGDTAGPYLTYADICMSMEKYEDAIKVLENILERILKVGGIEPNNTNAMQKLQDAQFQLKKQKRTNYYELLGIMTVASSLEIKDAYRQKAMEWHPDKWTTKSDEEKQKAEQMFKSILILCRKTKIQEGYEVLTDPFKKELYDKGHDLEAINEQVQMKQHREKMRAQHHH